MNDETEQAREKKTKIEKERDVLRLVLLDPATARRRLAKEDDWLLWESALRH